MKSALKLPKTISQQPKVVISPRSNSTRHKANFTEKKSLSKMTKTFFSGYDSDWNFSYHPEPEESGHVWIIYGNRFCVRNQLAVTLDKLT